MHQIHINNDSIAKLAGIDWLSLSTSEIQRVAYEISLGTPEIPLIRTGSEANRGSRYVKGSPARLISEEFADLIVQIKTLNSLNTVESRIRAICFYHLRLEGIHPLTDGNGRAGRLIMAMQARQLGWPGDINKFLDGLIDNTPFYRMLFLENIDDSQRFELLIDLVMRVLDTPGVVLDFDLPFSLAPKETERVGARFRFVPIPVSPETRLLIDAEERALLTHRRGQHPSGSS